MNYKKTFLLTLLMAGATMQAAPVTNALNAATTAQATSSTTACVKKAAKKYGLAALYTGGASLAGILSLTSALVAVRAFKLEFNNDAPTIFPLVNISNGPTSNFGRAIYNFFGEDTVTKARWVGDRSMNAFLTLSFAKIAYELGKKAKQTLDG